MSGGTPAPATPEGTTDTTTGTATAPADPVGAGDASAAEEGRAAPEPTLEEQEADLQIRLALIRLGTQLVNTQGGIVSPLFWVNAISAALSLAASIVLSNHLI